MKRIHHRKNAAVPTPFAFKRTLVPTKICAAVFSDPHLTALEKRPLQPLAAAELNLCLFLQLQMQFAEPFPFTHGPDNSTVSLNLTLAHRFTRNVSASSVWEVVRLELMELFQRIGSACSKALGHSHDKNVQ